MLAALLAALLLRLAVAPVPCGSNLKIWVEVGGEERVLGLSGGLEHGETEDRNCDAVNIGYMGVVVLGCDEGLLNATTDDCEPKVCNTYDSIAASVGDKTEGVMPRETIPHEGNETRLCRIVNPLYRGFMTIFCSFGVLTIDVSECIRVWDRLEDPPWLPRSRHTAIGLGDGVLLVVGGLGSAGPLREVWQYTPEMPPALVGRWEQPWIRPVPPWSGRFATALVRQVRESGEQVMLIAGNDGINRRDVWRWLRDASPAEIPLGDSDPTGTQPEDCLVGSAGLACDAVGGVSGRRWTIPYELWPSDRVVVELRYSGGGSSEGTAIVAVQLDSCRQVFQVSGGMWTSYGCTGTDPPWVARHAATRVRLGDGGELPPGEVGLVTIEIDRDRLELVLLVNGTAILPQAGAGGVRGVPIGGLCRNETMVEVSEDGVCVDAAQVPLAVRTIEIVAWPRTLLEVGSLSLTPPGGSWQLLVDDAPWPARSGAAAVPLPDGDILLIGGLGDEGYLNDVWRWSPRRCTLMADLPPLEAARVELECSFECQPSPRHGQWKQLPNGPWAPRSEHAALWTAYGLLLMGGRTATGFLNDVWRWTASGEFCSLEWQGRWVLLTPAAEWPPRHGHSVIGFALDGGAPDTVLVLGGFGGEPERRHVEREPLEYPVASRSDLWCGYLAGGSFSQWTRLAPYAPFTSRTQAAAVAMPTMGPFAMLVFGGYDEKARLVKDLWRWIGENMTAVCAVDEP